MIWLLVLVVYLLGIIPTGAFLLRYDPGRWVQQETSAAVLLGFFWPLMVFIVAPLLLSVGAICRAVEALAEVRRG